MTEGLQRKVEQAVRLLKSVCADGKPIEIAYSGGKDSDVLLELAKMAGVGYKAIYKNTTIDPPGTIRHVKDMGVEIRQPEKGFFKLVEEHGFPNRFRRFCCRYLKEYKILDRVAMGIRRSESRNRADMYSEPTECRFYGSKKDHVEAVYPMLEWTDDDVAEFIQERHITCAPLYYLGGGTFDVKKRLGCMCCPLASHNKRIAQFKEWPGMVRAYCRAGQKFMDAHPDSSAARNNKDAYEFFVRDVFYESNPQRWMEEKRNMFGQVDCKAFLEGYFKIKL